MAERQRMTVEEVVARLMSDEHADVLRDSLCWVVEQLMEAEVSELVGAAHGERTPDRATHRNGYRVADPEAQAGQLLPELFGATQAL